MSETADVVVGSKQFLNQRPLVTFALFTYNQERYVREAMEAAFAQTYDPMEIIVSDDCSSDRTMEIITELARTYSGSKRLIVRKTEKNRGTLLHVAEVARLAQGKLIILAAGDDISKPQRTETLVTAWKSSQAWGLCSKFDRINESGLTTACNETVPILSSPSYPLRKYFLNRAMDVKIIHGATSAYDKRLFEFLETRPEDYVLSEDGVLSVLLNILNKEIAILNDSLILYRENEQSLTNSGVAGRVSYHKTCKAELLIGRFAYSQSNRCSLFLRFDEKYGASSQIRLNKEQLLWDKENQLIRSCWWQLHIIDKVKYILKLRKGSDLKWHLPRLLPLPVFLAAKTLSKATNTYFSAMWK